MNERDWLAERFEENRAHLRAVAYRMLGSSSESDDAVQEAWLRLSRAETAGIANLSGWLTSNRHSFENAEGDPVMRPSRLSD